MLFYALGKCIEFASSFHLPSIDLDLQTELFNQFGNLLSSFLLSFIFDLTTPVAMISVPPMSSINHLWWVLRGMTVAMML
jgi:hypothetical protein